MSYQALYRVWRPQDFDEIVGQDMIAETLKNAVKNQQLSHAYLFTGPRGTGKTSAAKILAKAVNCPNLEDGNPCNECEICQSINSGQLSDVIEIDAASNNGVEEIRDLRDKVRYAPTKAEYKVYIIDEVHMLTTGAFNALLKTLEEPPDQVIFVLATTEPHKIPATIISRTQRFDFQRIKDQALIGRMKFILEHDDIDFEEEALAVIARAANGGMRDSLSMLDQSISYNQQALSTETALLISGSLNQQTFIAYILALYNEESDKALDIVAEQLQKGKQANRFIEELILFCRDMLLTQFSKANHTLLTEDELNSLRNEVPTAFYYQIISELNQAQSQMRFTNQPDIYLEVATIALTQVNKSAGPAESSKQTQAVDQEELGALKEQVALLEEQLANLQIQMKAQSQRRDSQPEAQQSAEVRPLNENADSNNRSNQAENNTNDIELTPRSRPKRQVEYEYNVQQIYKLLNEATRKDLQLVRQHWANVLGNITPIQRAKLSGTKPLAASPNQVLISFENQQFAANLQADRDLQQLLETTLTEITNHSYGLVIILEREWQRTRQNYKILRERNNGQPIEINDQNQTEKSDQVTEETVPVDSSSPQHDNDVSDVNEETSSMDQDDNVRSLESLMNESSNFSAEAIRSSSTSDDEKQSEDHQITQEHQQTERQVEVDNEEFLAENELEEHSSEKEIPDVVKKAQELFGPENINIFYDR